MPMISMYTTREMLQPLLEARTPATFFKDSFFGDTEQHFTERFDVDVEKEGRRMAAFVHPTHEAKTVERTGFRTESYKPAYIKEKRALTMQDIMSRQPGAPIHQSADEARAGLIRALSDMQSRDLRELKNRIVQRIEWQCREALWYGTLRCVGEGIDETITFGRKSSHTVTLGSGGTVKWGANGAKIVENIDDWCELLADSGYGATDMILGKRAAHAFLADTNVQRLLKDNSGVQTGGPIDLTTLPSNVKRLGTFAGLTFWRYSERYIDDVDNVSKPLVPENEVLLVDRSARRTLHFGPIMDLDAIAEESLTVSEFGVPFFPKMYSVKARGTRFLEVQSAPLPVPHAVDATVRAVVMS